MTELALFRDDGFNRLMQRMGFKTEQVRERIPIAAFLSLITLGGNAFFSLLVGKFTHIDPLQSFVMDFPQFIMYLIALPMLVLADPLIDRAMGRAGNRLQSLVLPEGQALLKDEILRVEKLRRNRYFDIAFIVAAYTLFTWFGWLGAQISAPRVAWWFNRDAMGSHLNLSGWWVAIVSGFLLPYFWQRSGWRIVIWTHFLYRVSKMPMRLAASHPDRAGGLGFLGRIQAVFGLYIFMAGMVAASMYVYVSIVVGTDKAAGTENLIPIGSFLIFGPSLFLGPLLMFTSKLKNLKEEALLKCEAFADSYLFRMNGKWFGKTGANSAWNEAGPDFDGASSLRGHWEAIQQMKIVPFDFKTVATLLLSSATPLVPIIIDLIPWPEVRQLLQRLGG